MIIPFVIAILAIIIDQVSKYYIKTTMEVGEFFNLIPNILNIRYIENPGASFGILADRRWVFMSLSSVAIVFMFAAILYLGRKSVAKYNRLLNIGLGLMLGGAIGNMIDRFFNVSEAPRHEGMNVVIDFLEFDFVDFAIFNFADVFITMGAVVMCICIPFEKYKLKLKVESEHEQFDDIIDDISNVNINVGDAVLCVPNEIDEIIDVTETNEINHEKHGENDGEREQTD